jgi:hypothetical protein
MVGNVLAQMGAQQTTAFKLSSFETGLAKLHDDVRSWSGNSMQAIVRTTLEWNREVHTDHATAKTILREGLTLFEVNPLGTTQFGLEKRALDE